MLTGLPKTQSTSAHGVDRFAGSGRAPNHAAPRSVERVAKARLPTEWGKFRIAGYRSLASIEEFTGSYR